MPILFRKEPAVERLYAVYEYHLGHLVRNRKSYVLISENRPEYSDQCSSCGGEVRLGR